MEVISHHSVLFPVLRLSQAVLASLSSDNMSAASQIVHFLAGHEELTSIILRGSAARSSMHPSFLQELALMTSVVSRSKYLSPNLTKCFSQNIFRSAILDLKHDMMDASSLELQGQLSRMQKQMMALLHQFQINESLINSLQSSKHSQASTLHVLQIISKRYFICQNFSASFNSRSTR